MRVIEGPAGDIWFTVKGRTVLYIRPNGTLCVPGDVEAFARIPDPPP